MTVIFEVALLLIGSWNCVRDRTMKALWFGFAMVFVTIWSVFRQHRLRVKFDSSLRNVEEPPTSECDQDCQKANVFGGQTAIAFWHVTEVVVPTFFVFAAIYSVRWRIALAISDRLMRRRDAS